MTTPIAEEVGLHPGWPRLKLEKPGFPVVYLYPVGAPHPGGDLVRIRPLVALGMDPQHPNQFIDRRDPLAHLAEPAHDA